MPELTNAVHVTLHDRSLGNDLNDTKDTLIYRNTTEEQAILFARGKYGDEIYDTNRFYLTASTYDTTPLDVFVYEDEEE